MIARDGPQHLPVGVGEIGADHVRPEGVPGRARHPPHDLGEVERRVRRARDREQRLVLVEPLARVGVELRVLERRGGLRREQRQQLDLLGSEPMGRAREHGERAERAVAGHERDGDAMRVPARPHPLRVRLQRILEDVRGAARTAAREHPGHERVVERQVRGTIEHVFRVAAARRGEAEARGGGIHHPDPRDLGAEQLHRRLHDAVEHLLEVLRRGHHVVERREAAQAREPLLRLPVQARVPDRGGGGRGERLTVLDVVGRPRPPGPRHARHDADRDPVDDQRDAEVRPDALDVEPRAIPDASIVLDVLHLERSAAVQDASGQALVAHGIGRHLGVGPPRARQGGEGQAARAVLGQQDADEVGPHELERDGGEAVEHLSQVERGGEQTGRFRETPLRRAVVAARGGGSAPAPRLEVRRCRVHGLALSAGSSPPGAFQR